MQFCVAETAFTFCNGIVNYAIQNQVIATRVIESKVLHKSVPSILCRLCHKVEETIVHLQLVLSLFSLLTFVIIIWLLQWCTGT